MGKQTTGKTTSVGTVNREARLRGRKRVKGQQEPGVAVEPDGGGRGEALATVSTAWSSSGRKTDISPEATREFSRSTTRLASEPASGDEAVDERKADGGANRKPAGFPQGRE